MTPLWVTKGSQITLKWKIAPRRTFWCVNLFLAHMYLEKIGLEKWLFFVLISMTHRYQITGWDLDVALPLSILIILVYGLLGLSSTLWAVGVLNWPWVGWGRLKKPVYQNNFFHVNRNLRNLFFIFFQLLKSGQGLIFACL